MSTLPYRYFIAYSTNGGGVGNEMFSRARPILDMDDVIAIQRDIEEIRQCGPVCVTNWIRLPGGTER